jgi:hypothetical protein
MSQQLMELFQGRFGSVTFPFPQAMCPSWAKQDFLVHVHAGDSPSMVDLFQLLCHDFFGVPSEDWSATLIHLIFEFFNPQIQALSLRRPR